MNRKLYAALVSLVVVAMLTACEPETIIEQVEVTKIVEKEVIVEGETVIETVIETVVEEKIVEVEVEVTPTPVPPPIKGGGPVFIGTGDMTGRHFNPIWLTSNPQFWTFPLILPALTWFDDQVQPIPDLAESIEHTLYTKIG